MVSCLVGLASNPFFFKFRQTSQAVNPFMGSISTAFSRPFPLTVLTIGLFVFISSIFARKIFPIRWALSARFSSTKTWREAIPTAQARGFPPKVDPCSPGFIVSITSSSAKTAETGMIPPLRAFPKIRTSGLTNSWSQASIFPVLHIPV